MDESGNERALRLANALAARYGWEVRPMRARFTSGGEGFSLVIYVTDPVAQRYNSRVMSFYNDDKYGPRWTGLAGRRIPGRLVIPYAREFAKDETAHPGMVNRILPDQT
jgi:hypothetical protein